MSIKDELLLSLMAPLTADGGSPLPADIASLWLKIVRKFAPLIGADSLLVILERSFDDHADDFPWLPALNPLMQPDTAIDALLISMTPRSNDDILAAHNAILASYIDMIATLIGMRLTVQFLRAALPADDASNPEEIPE